MHGEYKVPGGKLVVVDLEEREGRIHGFHLAGDFFLEPDDALDDIDAAIIKYHEVTPSFHCVSSQIR